MWQFTRFFKTEDKKLLKSVFSSTSKNGHFGSLLGSIWVNFRLFWAILGLFWAILGYFEPLFDPFWAIWAIIWPFLSYLSHYLTPFEPLLALLSHYWPYWYQYWPHWDPYWPHWYPGFVYPPPLNPETLYTHTHAHTPHTPLPTTHTPPGYHYPMAPLRPSACLPRYVRLSGPLGVHQASFGFKTRGQTGQLMAIFGMASKSGISRLRSNGTLLKWLFFTVFPCFRVKMAVLRPIWPNIRKILSQA